MCNGMPVLFAQPGNQLIVSLGIGFLVFLAIVLIIVLFKYGNVWFQAYMAQANVSLLSLIGMTFRQVDSRVIVQAKIMAIQAGIGSERETGITTRRLEAHYLAGGNVPNVISAIIASHRAAIDLDFDRACAIDLAGRDVLEAVQTSVYPKVIDCPDPRRSQKSTLSAIAKNGVELKVRARGYCANQYRAADRWSNRRYDHRPRGRGHYHGDWIGEHALSRSWRTRIWCPRRFWRGGWTRKLRSRSSRSTSPDIDVGQNIGARLQADQAEADTRVAQAKAEERRAAAAAREQEMKAAVAKNRALVTLAEAEVPKAMSAAFREGNLEGARHSA